ncbi:hypothetical protein BN982_02329 [Halobacillus karajensis]|nr:hypothetical protein BN982_02329 [Halobacillus karajensis]
MSEEREKEILDELKTMNEKLKYFRRIVCLKSVKKKY